MANNEFTQAAGHSLMTSERQEANTPKTATSLTVSLFPQPLQMLFFLFSIIIFTASNIYGKLRQKKLVICKVNWRKHSLRSWINETNVNKVLPSASCQTWLKTTGFKLDSSMANTLANSSGLSAAFTNFVQRARCCGQFGWRNGPGMLLSNWRMFWRRVPSNTLLEPRVTPLQLNSLTGVRLNLCERWRFLSRSSLCWFLFSAKEFVLYWFSYSLKLPSAPKSLYKNTFIRC